MDEHQQDANSALLELDKGLRAHKVGEQCEAIVRFPSLFARFPFPILINSAFLKLADAFRTGNNFTRICIMRVAQQSTKHLDKILNVDEFMKRVYMVIHSNDPYARALTLRMLGSVSCIMSEKKNAHHSIQQGLDSHDRVEQQAAIFATAQFASHSCNFASGICNKISTMLQGLSTPLEIKLKLIPVMQHMHYNAQISSKARSILQDLLPSYPAQDFVLTTLNTLTQLAVHSQIDIPEQVTLLLQYLRCDPREAVKSDSLRNLKILAKSAPHLWTMQDSAAMCEAFKLSTLSNSLKRDIIHVLCTLTQSDNLSQININEDGPLLQLCQQCCYDLDVIQAALATKLYASITRHASRLSTHRQASLLDDAVDAAEALLLIVAPSSERNATDRVAMKIILPALQQLCASSKHAGVRLVKGMMSLLTSNELSVISETSESLLETIASIAFTSRSPGLLSHYNSKLFLLLRNSDSGETGSEKEISKQQIVATLLCTLLFISNQERGKSTLNNRLIDTVESSNLNHWTLYRIARQASRMGQHAVANRLFSRISSSVASEHHYFWLVGLADLSLAESVISRHFAAAKPAFDKAQNSSELTTAINHYHQTITSLMAAVTPNHALNFQCEYTRLRCESLLAHTQLLNACSLIRTCPPPAISAMSSAGEGSSASEPQSVLANGILLTQMKACADWFLSVDTGYSELHMTSFDSDPSTLSNIDILQQCCSIMAYAIDVLILSRSTGQGPTSSRNLMLDGAATSKNDDHYTRALKKAFADVMTKLEEILKLDTSSKPLSHVHTNCLIQCSAIILSVPHSFPRYFYQSLQTTNIKLAISPSQHSANEPVSVEINQHLALKVEGVVQHENTRSHDQLTSNGGQHDEANAKAKFRNVGKIKLNMKKIKQGQSKSNTKIEEGNTELEDVVVPHNDYFCTQFLIKFPVTGIYNILIETSVNDDEGIWWKTGPKETILVKAYDDSVRTNRN